LAQVGWAVQQTAAAIRNLCRRFASWNGAVSTSFPWLCHSGIIGLVSVYDMMLTVKYAQHLKYLEQNPVGRWMMRLDEIQHGAMPDLTFFLSAKSLGTVLVLATLWWLYQRQRRIGHSVAWGVSSCQVALLWYLTVATVGE
jgi:hypothetical protein